MKKLPVLILAMVLSGALAQGRLFGEVASGGLTLVPSFSANLGVRAGAENVLGPLALRGGATLSTFSGGTVLTFEADALYFLRSGSPDFYVGGGGGLGLFISGGTTSVEPALNLTAGVEIPVTPDFNLFAEVRPTLSFPPGQDISFALDILFGPRLYLR